MVKIKKKILFGITSLTIGGAERVLVDISNKLSKEYDITIFSIYDKGELKEELSPDVKFKPLYKKSYKDLTKLQKVWIPLKILFFSKFIYERNIKQDYDIEIAFLEGPITRLFSNKNGGTRKIAWIHNDISKVFGKSLKSKIKRLIDKKIYSKYNDLIFVSKENMKSFKNTYPEINEKNMQVIYNYIDSNLIIKKSQEQGSCLGEDKDVKIVTVCRLVEQKAIDRLAKIHSRIIKQGYKHKIFVIGDGPEKEKIQNIVKNENIEDTFILMGKKENPYPYIKEADYFCLLSHFEGYGMVLEEAKILNKRIIITDTAAKEALEGYSNGIILANDEQSIYEGLVDVIKQDKNKNESCSESYNNNEQLENIKQLLN